MSPAFHRWQGLTDAYAKQLESLSRREPGASARLQQIGIQLAACHASFMRDTKPK